ncbi:hypothetical protein LTR78_000152 [Recurvomyces mirabilis]|uniref:Cytochrome P450 n=1 Tax=Recurvomyces mirabilis TaxID=574656 RepID=A0AAE1C6B9_9PEZI|nr:hypothetical protein LTR78_000152 [Recurvomyces mirabilis]KAK5161809.1 hypothetical protein LTS14_000154 [Recurvomyces mirabilis]
MDIGPTSSTLQPFAPLARTKDVDSVPFKGGQLFNGHAKLISDERSGSPMHEWINEVPNDGLIRYRMKRNQERVFVTSVKGLAEVLVQRNYDFVKPTRLRYGLGRILGVGLIIAEGDEHKQQRRQLMPAFAHRHVKDLYSIFWSKSAELAQALTTEISDNRSVVNIADWLPRATLDIIGVAGLGQDFRAIQNPDNQVCNAYARVFDQSPPKGKLAMLKMVVKELLPSLSKRNDTIAVASQALKQVSRQLIRQKKAERQVTKSIDKDILSVALDSEAFTEEQLVNQTMTFLAAGHETTATSMTWATLALCRHQDVQAKLREEIRAKLPPPGVTDASPMTAELLDSLPYLHAVCSEVLRVYPPAGLTKRVAAKDTTILGQYIPKGTNIIISMRAINHSKELWGEDAAEFKPDRWLGVGKAGNGGASSNYSYMTFLHGPRSCIGQSFAKGEFASLLAVLVGCFEMELADPGKEIKIVTGLTSRPKGGLNVRMQRVSGW